MLSSASATHLRAELAALSSASQVLKLFEARLQASPSGILPLHDAVALLTRLEELKPSVHDERLLALVRQILAEKENLSLTSIVDVSTALERLKLHQELPQLTRLAIESASFLPGDIIMSLAKTLAVSARSAPDAVDAATQATVFRILGEHISEDLFDTAPEALGEALLAIASFYCSRRSVAPDPAVVKPWHPEVFASCAELLLGRAASVPPMALVKWLRAYKLFLLSGPRLQADMEECDRAAVELLPIAIGDALVLVLAEIPVRAVVRSFHAMAALHGHGLELGDRGAAFCAAATQEVKLRAKELDVHDIAFSLQSVAIIAGRDHSRLPQIVPCAGDLLSTLQGEVQHHVPALTLRSALMMIKAFEQTALVEPPEAGILELLAAEFLRELRNLQPSQICDISVAYSRLRFQNPGFFHALSLAFVSELPRAEPRHAALTLYSFAKMDVSEDRVYPEASKHIVKNLLGFTPRDVAISLWAFAKVMHRDSALLSAVQEDLKRQDTTELRPADVSMILWSFSRYEVDVDPDLLGSLMHYVARGSRSFDRTALMVTCLALARMGFAQQQVLVDLYRSLYAKLPELTDSQLAFGFFLFSSSGIRDQPLVSRFLFECRQRLPRLKGQELSNVLLACSRTVVPSALEEPHALRDGLRSQIFEQLHHLGRAPLLGVYLAAPTMLGFTEEDNLQVMSVIAGHLEQMDAAELVRCLLATVKTEMVHKPLLLPLFHHLRKKRKELQPGEAVSCVWAVHALGFVKPKFRRTLAYVLLYHVRHYSIAPRTLRDVLPALSELGIWERLPASLRRTVWRLAGEDLRRYASPPPPALAPPLDALEPASTSRDKWTKENTWRLTPLQPGLLRRKVRRRDQQVAAAKAGVAVVQKPGGWEAQQLKSMKVDAKARERAAEKEVDQELGQPVVTGKSAVQDFVQLIRRL